MRVGIDAHMVGSRETGNETYVKGLVEGFKEVDGVDLVAFYVGAAWTDSTKRVHLQRLLTASPYVRLGVELPLRALREHLDLLHMTYAAPAWSATPIVLTVHDICYATNPEWFSPRDLRVLSSMVPRSIRAAAHVITVSQAARAEIIDRYRVPEANISAIPNGPGAAAGSITDEAARTELAAIEVDPQRPYLLAVGNVQPRKNLVRLLQAFKQLAGDRGHDVNLLIVGPRRYRAEDVIQAAGADNKRVHFTGYVTDRQLAACYRCSTAFVYPSLYEGFGLPALEAMAHGVPIACSRAGALPEVCGDAAVFFDPRSVDEMVEAVDSILRDAALRRRLSAAGTARAKEFSWKRSAEQTLEAYRKALA